MGRVKESLIDLHESMEQRDDPPRGARTKLPNAPRNYRLKTPEEQWKEQGYYPDGEKYDDGEEEDNNQTTYDSLREEVKFEPDSARKARQEAIASQNHQPDKQQGESTE